MNFRFRCTKKKSNFFHILCFFLNIAPWRCCSLRYAWLGWHPWNDEKRKTIKTITTIWQWLLSLYSTEYDSTHAHICEEDFYFHICMSFYSYVSVWEWLCVCVVLMRIKRLLGNLSNASFVVCNMNCRNYRTMAMKSVFFLF